MSKGYVYILTNPCFKSDIVKIGRTVNLEERVKKLSEETGTPSPFECYAAFEFEDCSKVEALMHSIYRGVNMHTDKIHTKKEFFNIRPEIAYDVLQKIAELANGHEIVLDEEKAYSKNEIKILNDIEIAEEKRQKNFKFEDFGIKVGADLVFQRNPQIVCKVVENNKVEYQGKIYSLSNLTLKIMSEMGLKGKRTGYRYWLYKGEILNNIREKHK